MSSLVNFLNYIFTWTGCRWPGCQRHLLSHLWTTYTHTWTGCRWQESASSLVSFLNYLPDLAVAGKNQRHLLSTFSTIYLNWLSLARMSVPFLVNFLNYLPELTFAGKDQRHLLSTFLTFYLNWLSPARISAMDMLAGTIILSTMCTIPLVAIEHGRRITVFFLLTPVFLYKNSIIGKAARG